MRRAARGSATRVWAEARQPSARESESISRLRRGRKRCQKPRQARCNRRRSSKPPEGSGILMPGSTPAVRRASFLSAPFVHCMRPPQNAFRMLETAVAYALSHSTETRCRRVRCPFTVLQARLCFDLPCIDVCNAYEVEIIFYGQVNHMQRCWHCFGRKRPSRREAKRDSSNSDGS